MNVGTPILSQSPKFPRQEWSEMLQTDRHLIHKSSGVAVDITQGRGCCGNQGTIIGPAETIP